MSKIYRLHSGASDTVQDWTQIDSYLGTAAIDLIPDNAGADAKKQITSIPSPFARIDLIKTAFRNVVSTGKPEGLSIFHRMVSDALDVGQVFFNSTNPTSKVEIIAWNPGLTWVGEKMVVDPESDLGQLISKQESHKLYGETLKMFFEQDAVEYNFKDLQQFYLINYKDGPGRFNIIGGTSPATLFFSSANSLDYVDLNFKNDKLFDDIYCPLHERSEDYILFLYSLKHAMPKFSERFKVVDDYMEMCYRFLEEDTRRKVSAITHESYGQNYANIALAGEGNHPEIAGLELRGIKADREGPMRRSDFVIVPTHLAEGLLPLVLPAYTFNGPLNYVDGKWSPQIKAPFFDARPLAERILPGQEIKYPYLTVSDFLEPYLLQLPFEPDQDKFFDGYFPKGNNEGYLLPLTQSFFTYFSTADLRTSLPDGRHMFEFEKLPGNAVKARLRIPVKNGRFIEMERIYVSDMAQLSYTEPDVINNRGIIRSQKFSLAIYPFVKYKFDPKAAYTIMLLDQDVARSASSQYLLKYYKDGAADQKIEPKTSRQKSNKQQHQIDTKYDVVFSTFDFIAVEHGKLRGCLVPNFKVVNNNSGQYSFAIDFGTTNTHIEYCVDGGSPKPFDITDKDQQLGTLHKWNEKTYEHLNTARFGKFATMLMETVPKEMMPEHIGGMAKYKFPCRTVVSEPLGVDTKRDTYPLADFSMYWEYGSGIEAPQLQARTNLKWSSFTNGKDMSKRIEGYIANLILLVRNKVALNGGDLSQTKIIWFYPTSMTEGRLNRIDKIWNDQVKLYIGDEINVMRLPESVAPFYFFRKQNGAIAGNQPVINIDIGGGTTDVVVYKKDTIVSFTSFKFAGNTLFGDVYNKPPSNNGFVQFFEKECREMLKGTPLDDLLPAVNNIEKSEEFITAVFGLRNHPGRGEISFSFTEKLNETEELKIIPLLFISSIFYHIAKCQKYKNGEIPRYITFSGTASKMLHILDVSKKLKSVTKLANTIFNDVFEVNSAAIELIMADGPKEVTAKGGLLNPSAILENKFVLFGVEDALPYKELTYEDASEKQIQDVAIAEVSSFIDKFFKWNSILDFANEFALNTKRFSHFKTILKKDLEIFLDEGIGEMKEEMNGDNSSTMNETLFFLPLKGAFNNLAFEITENK
jgi:hypothetical protein